MGMRRKKNIRRADISLALDQIEILDPVAKAAYDKMRKQIRSGNEMQARSFVKTPGKEVQKESAKENWSMFKMFRGLFQKIKREKVAV